MKKLLSITAVLMLLFVGCSKEENGIINPINEANLDISLNNNSSTLEKSLVPTITVSKLIDGAVGGWINLSDEYIDSLGRSMQVKASLFFPQNSFEGTEIITMTADFSNASVIFSPHMQFNKSASLTVEYKNLPLSEMGYNSNSKVDFVYFADDGNIYPVGSKGVSMNFSKGNLKVTNSWLYHFSRYGFVRNSL